MPDDGRQGLWLGSPMPDNVTRLRRRWTASPQQAGPAAGPGRSASAVGTIALVALAFVASMATFGWLLGGAEVPAMLRQLSVSAPSEPVAVRFERCVSGQGTNCVIDGDTLRIHGTIIRVADIDTPEVRNYSCAAEKLRGDRATQRLLALLNAGPFAVEAYERDADRYGRKLRILTRDGNSLGMILVAEGLARPWDGARRSWC